MHHFAFGMPGPTELIVILLIVTVTYLLPAGLVGFLAWNYGRSPVAWFFLSILVTPLLAIIALVALGRIESE
jgi:hypothetical protein